MGEDPDEIREEIEATRDRMSDTADALSYKANVVARAREQATAKKDALLGRVRAAAPTSRGQAVEQLTATKDRLVGKAGGVAKNPGQARRQSADATKRAAAALRRNPRPVAAAGGLAVVLGLAAFRRARRSVGAIAEAPAAVVHH